MNHVQESMGKNGTYLMGGLLSMGALVLLDQWTKSRSVSCLRGRPSLSLIPGVLELKYLENTGAAFGLFAGKKNFFLMFCMLFFILFIYFYRKLPKNRHFLPLLAVLFLTGSGALGNFIDRASRGYVVDFIYFSLIDFPIFNMADIYVVTGGILLVLLVCFRYQEEDFELLFPGRKGRP